MNYSTTFEVTIMPQRATTGTMETVVRESLKAIGIDSNIIIIQKNDTTLDVTICERVKA